MKKLVLAAAAFAALMTAPLAHSACIPADFKAVLPAPPQDDWVDAQRLKLMEELRTPERIAHIREEANDPTPKFWAAAGIQPSAYL